MVHVLTVDHGVAVGLHGVQAGARETGRVVTVPTEQSTQRAPSDLGQLSRGELEVDISRLVPEPAAEESVTTLQDYYQTKPTGHIASAA